MVRALWGYSLPKQFVSLNGSQSLLQATIERIRPLGFHRCLVVVGRNHESVARSQLEGLDGVETIVQPANLGTGPGLLLPLAHVQARDPAATVAIFPSDHHIPNPAPFLEGVDHALESCKRGKHPLVLFGNVADRPERDYGWILPGAPIVGSNRVRLFRVDRFIEKPNEREAKVLHRRGGLWNTFVLVGALQEFWSLTRKTLPVQARAFERFAETIGTPEERGRLESLYTHLTPANFSHDVLEKTSTLAVVRVAGSGWSDLGTPERFLRAVGEDLAVDGELAGVS
jgi:mannose-1-phosphate guanylyltransferase